MDRPLDRPHPVQHLLERHRIFELDKGYHMTDTYTFTARSADDSRHVATFTLFDHEMAVDPGEPLVEARLLHPAGRSGSRENPFV